MGIKDLAGIKYFTNLKELYCSDNQLTSLDVHECTKLQHLECDGNQLKSLDVSLCPLLKELCDSTKAEKEDVFLVYESADGKMFLTVDPSVNVITVHTHTWDPGKVTKAATPTSTGIRTYTCKVCGDTKTEIIDKTEPITIFKKPMNKKPVVKKNKITVTRKRFKHTSKTAKKFWKKIKKVQIQCATDSGFKNIVKDVMIGRGKTKYTIKGLNKKTTYHVRVRYYDGTGYSNWSSVKKAKTK